MNKANPSVATFLATLTHLHYSANTIRAYEKDLKTFASWMKENIEEARWSIVTTSIMQDYLTTLLNRGYETNSTLRMVRTISSYYTWMVSLGYLQTNPCQNLRKPRMSKKITSGTDENAVLATIKDSLENPETRTCIAILYDSGIRISELERLEIKDIDFSTCELTIIGKGNKQRRAYVSEGTRNMIARYFPAEGRCILTEDRNLRYNIWTSLRRHGEKQFASPHCIRRLYANKRINGGMELQTLSRLMGHENISTTERYFRLNNDTLRNAATTYIQ